MTGATGFEPMERDEQDLGDGGGPRVGVGLILVQVEALEAAGVELVAAQAHHGHVVALGGVGAQLAAQHPRHDLAKAAQVAERHDAARVGGAQAEFGVERVGEALGVHGAHEHVQIGLGDELRVGDDRFEVHARRLGHGPPPPEHARGALDLDEAGVGRGRVRPVGLKLVEKHVLRVRVGEARPARPGRRRAPDRAGRPCPWAPSPRASSPQPSGRARAARCSTRP